MNTCKEEIIAGCSIKIQQNDNGTFAVAYGSQFRDDMSYNEAAAEYGFCVFHALSCAGEFDQN